MSFRGVAEAAGEAEVGRCVVLLFVDMSRSGWSR
jgi:hypothetical protein